MRTKRKHILKESDVWQIQEAKAQFSKLIDIVQEKGIQKISKNGKVVAVLLSMDKFEEYARPKNTLIDFFKNAPDYDLDIKRPN